MSQKTAVLDALRMNGAISNNQFRSDPATFGVQYPVRINELRAEFEKEGKGVKIESWQDKINPKLWWYKLVMPTDLFAGVR